MNELLAEYAGKAILWLESGAAWISGEIPLYIEEVLRWNMALSVIGVVVPLIIMTSAMFLIKPIIKLDKKARSGETSISYYVGEHLFWLIPIGIATTVCFTIIVINLLTAIQITVAPRVFLIEYLSKMM